jgi:hypothetical protein
LEDQEQRRKKASRREPLQIMVVRGLGKVRNLRISYGLLWFSFLFLSAYLVLSIFVINDYFQKRREGFHRATHLEGVEREMEATKKELFRMQQQVILLEEYIARSGSGDPPAKVAPAVKKAVPEPPSLPDRAPPEQKREETPENVLVDIQDFHASKKGAKWTFSYKVVNLQEGEGNSLRGHVHLVITDRGADPSRMWTFSKGGLREGEPADYKSGQPFVIRNYRTMSGEFLPDHAPSALKVLIYGEEGMLLLEKEFEVKDP